MPTAAANIATFLGLTFREITGVVASVTNHALTITGADNRILLVNPAFSRITGFSCAEFFGQEPFMWKTDRSSPDFYVETWPVLRDKGVWEGDLWNQNKAGQAFSEQPKSSGEVFHVARFTDVSSRVRLRLRQVKNRLTDGLTGLPNRLGFVNELRSALGRTSVPSVAVNVVNIDQFRRVGERAGHDAGDQLLNRIACALWRRLRASEEIVRTAGALAQVRSKDLVAEGVETAEQSRRRVKLGCEAGQGWHYAR